MTIPTTVTTGRGAVGAFFRGLNEAVMLSFVILLGWMAGSSAAEAGPIAYNRPGVFPLPWGSYDVWLVNSDRSNNHRIPVPSDLLSAQQPEWSRDGQLIAATGFVCNGAQCKQT